MSFDVTPYLDEWGLPGSIQKDGSIDGGDACAILTNISYLTDEGFLYSIKDDAPVRHPYSKKWFGQTDRFSRDQLTPLQCALLKMSKNNSEPALPLFKAHKKHWFLHAWNTRGNHSMDAPLQKPDVTGPLNWALWLRIFKPFGRHLILWALDLQNTFSAIHWRFFRKDNVTRNHMLSVIACYEHERTLISWLNFKLVDWDDLIERWRVHCAITREPPTDILFRDRIDLLRRTT